MATKKSSFKSKSLKDYLDAKKRPTRLIGDVERYLLTLPEEDRDYTYIHPSDLIKDDYCLREGFYLLNGYPKKGGNPNLRLQNIFDEGNTIHRKWQSRFEGMNVLWGMWDNGPGTDVRFGLPDCVPAQGRRYREVPVHDWSRLISGKGDGLIVGLGDRAWLELKSVGPGTIRKEAPFLFRSDENEKDAWNNVRKPFPGHLRQTLLYLYLASKTYDFDVQEGVLIYEWKADQSIKEFVVQRDDELILPYLAKADLVVDAVEAEKAPDCNVKEGGCSACKPYGVNDEG